MTAFSPRALPVLIGSMPQKDHAEAADEIAAGTPDIPVWAQLPAHPQEGMVPQFLPGMPGWSGDVATSVVDLSSNNAETDLVAFYEEVMAVDARQLDLEQSRFTLTPDHAGGFYELIDRLGQSGRRTVAVKGQVTGPVTFTMAVKDTQKRSIIYDPQTRDAAVQLLALKARWQVRRLAPFAREAVIIFMDEPALAGFGSSEMISITPEDIVACLETVGRAIQSEGGLAGIHVCANTDWSMVIESGVDIINFDAYGYFDRFVLFPEQIVRFVDAGGIIAWGLVPTARAEDIQRETTDSLFDRWQRHLEVLEGIGLDPDRVLSQSLITPSCGAGSLTPALANRVVTLTRKLSDRIRSQTPPR
jgi:methionine synthase II (cobalamin-independent)